VALDARVKLFNRREAGEALLFVGEAGSVSGEVWLENRDAREIELRPASLHAPQLRLIEGARAGGTARVSLPKYLRGHERQLVSIAFDVDPSNPPGTYDASLVIEDAEGTATFPAQIVVTQDYSLSIEPDELVVTAPPGGSFAGEVVVVNEGNVPIDVWPLGEFSLDDPWREPRCCCCCRDDKVGAGEAEHESPESDAEPEFGVVVIDNERTTVQPGTSATVKFVGHVPDDVPANMHLRARPRIGTKRFSLDVITPPGGVSEPRSEPSRRRSTQKRKRS